MGCSSVASIGTGNRAENIGDIGRMGLVLQNKYTSVYACTRTYVYIPS